MDREQKSIERIKTASEMSLGYYGLPLVCTYSGGKDSDVMLQLFRRSGVPFEVHHSHTTADAPQTVYHIRKVFRQLELEGIKCTIDYHSRGGQQDIHVELDSTETYAANKACEVLLQRVKRNRMRQPHDRNRRSLE